MPRERSEGMVDSFLGMFSPFTAISRELQSTLQLDRLPACRSDHGRLEILLRGGGMTADTMENRIALARRLTEAARPILRARRKREHRRLADRAMAVVFEDEQIVADGIATSRFTFLASHDFDTRQQESNDSGGRAIESF